MRLGAALPVFGFAGRPVDSRHFAEASQRIERLGYASIWVFDAVGRGFILPDPLMGLMLAATVTERVELGTGVLQLPIRKTTELAHRILTLYLVAGDRLLLGVGPGSTEDDFRAFGGDYEARMARFAEQLPKLRELLRSGKHGETDLTPWAATSGGPPIFYGAWRGSWVERAAREADGWIASAMHNDDATLADAIARFRDAGGKRAVVTNVQVGPEIGPALERLLHLRELGFDDAVALDLSPDEERLEALLRDYQRACPEG
jgi:alkanesulfonate monooxygenase SsuD/methylene tetrahydromethanopterin reductase-like flavin-dependent oxidoreductase (luciferase family)